MKRHRTLTIIIILLGAILIIFSGYRWLQIYSDPSSAFFGMVSGAILIMVGYLHQRVSDNHEEIQELHRALDIMNQLMELKFKKLKGGTN